MPKFEVTERRTITIRAPKQQVVEAMSRPSGIERFKADVDTAEYVDDRTVRWVLEEMNERGVRFRGDYTVQYDYDGGDVVSWRTVRAATMSSRGTARLTAVDDHTTRVTYSESIWCEMEMNRLLGRVFKKVVEHKIGQGIREYLERIRVALERDAGVAA